MWICFRGIISKLIFLCGYMKERRIWNKAKDFGLDARKGGVSLTEMGKTEEEQGW